jgi:hypothetical protein
VGQALDSNEKTSKIKNGRQIKKETNKLTARSTKTYAAIRNVLGIIQLWLVLVNQAKLLPCVIQLGSLITTCKKKKIILFLLLEMFIFSFWPSTN